MGELWRISNYRDLKGEGGRRYSARWHNAGRPIVYLAETAAGALLEVLVHLELPMMEPPPEYTLLRVSYPENLTISELTISDDAWRSNIEFSRQVGDQWLQQEVSALARVPSAILPRTFNVLLNPMHQQASLITIEEEIHWPYDVRLLR